MMQTLMGDSTEGQYQVDTTVRLLRVIECLVVFTRDFGRIGVGQLGDQGGYYVLWVY